MRLWSTTLKPRRFATSRACWRAATMSRSPSMGRVSSVDSGAAMPILRREESPEQRQTLVGVQRGAHPLELQAQLDQGNGEGRLDTHDHGVGAEQARAERYVAQE